MKKFEHILVVFCGDLMLSIRSLVLGLGLLFLTVFELSAQQIPPSRIILGDSIQLGDSARHGMINRIIQPFRFRENQIRKQKERVVDLIRKLATDGDMSIDSATVYSIANDLMLLTDSLAATRGTTQLLQQEIQRTLINLDSKAPKQLVDSIQVQLGNVLQGLLDESKAANTEARKKLQEKLFALRQIQFSCGADGLFTSQDTLGDSLIVDYQKCLKASTRIFGWHVPSMNARIQNYNLNYLTDLILNGYELGANGSALNPKVLEGLFRGGILVKNQRYGKAVSLSVFSNSASAVAAFLNSNASQTQFFSQIKYLVETHNLNGINISFSQIEAKDKSNFAEFIKRLKSELLKIDTSQILTLNVPPIANRRNLAMASSAFDYESLNAWVDFYLVETQKLNITATRIPFSLNPLYPDVSKGRGSIEETFSFYSNGKVPVGKLVMTVSYQGITWSMPNFEPGTRSFEFGSILDYKTIQENIVATIGQPNGAVLGYDPEQASAYLNYGTVGNLSQVWFNDSRSLADKYSWALNNAIGGVAIWGLGGDDGYTELWDVLGATLIEVDSVVIKTQPLKKTEGGNKLSFWDYFSIYRADIQLAAVNDIYIGDPDQEIYCFFDPYPKREKVYELARIEGITDFWQITSKFVSSGHGYYYIQSCQACVSLLGRWDRYTEITEIASITFFALSLISTILLMLGIKRHGDEWSLRGIFLGISITTGLLCIVAFFFFCFFNTQIEFIGAGSNEVGVWVLISIFVIGITAGLIITKLRMAKKFSYHDLP